MRDHHMKRHSNLNHSNDTLHHGEEHPQYMNIIVDSQYKAHDKHES